MIFRHIYEIDLYIYQIIKITAAHTRSFSLGTGAGISPNRFPFFRKLSFLLPIKNTKVPCLRNPVGSPFKIQC